MNFLDELKVSLNLTKTQNDALTYKSSLNPLVDFFAICGGARDKSDGELFKYLSKAYAFDATLCVKTLLYLRDIKKGMGEREVFRRLMKIMLHTHPLTALEILKQIPDLGRWDDIIKIWYDNQELDFLNDFVKKLIQDTLQKDLNSTNPTLLAKWLPSENTSSFKSRKIARALIKILEFKPKEYRQILSKLRKKICIVENFLRQKDYSFDYVKLPSKALRKYSSAFYQNDKIRIKAFYQSIAEGKVKLKTSSLTPFDVVRECLNLMSSYESQELIKRKEILARLKDLDLTWQNLENVFEDRNLDMIVAADVSGSMQGEPMICSISLALLIAQQNKGAFHNHFIDFCGQPRLHNISGIKELWQLLKYIENSSLDMNTDIDLVFKLLLEAAKKSKAVPKYVMIISDMEFDSCCDKKVNFKYWKKLFKGKGFEFPCVIFWNVHSTSAISPALAKDNVLFVSGRSQNVLKALLDIDKFDFKEQNELSYHLIRTALEKYKIKILD